MRTPRALPVYPWGDNEKSYFGDDNDYAVYFNGTNFRIDSKVHELVISLAAATCYIYGGTATGDKLYIYADSVDARPFIFMTGNGSILMDMATDGGLTIRDAGSTANYFGTAASYHRSKIATGNNFKIDWLTATTTTAVVTGLDIDVLTNLTMGVNFGVTCLKLHGKVPNGAGITVGIDVSDFPTGSHVLKVPATTDVVTANPAVNAPAGWIKILVAAAARYIPYWTIDGA